ncbi:Protein CBG22818 [Caenorhabditis briggsae]|uniref:Protein CBG22818 n=1 Tax=Caenorhabditis briggsae TaxID=6238 RepID=A8Y347_CAEBR|nr:Protein CBG22818 [Caenorhabditis briggsae]CAP39316.1 Protein CBG22818 [Caenorhabditis briggsae]
MKTNGQVRKKLFKGQRRTDGHTNRTIPLKHAWTMEERSAWIGMQMEIQQFRWNMYTGYCSGKIWIETLHNVVRSIIPSNTTLKHDKRGNWRFIFISNYTTGLDKLKNAPFDEDTVYKNLYWHRVEHINPFQSAIACYEKANLGYGFKIMCLFGFEKDIDVSSWKSRRGNMNCGPNYRKEQTTERSKLQKGAYVLWKRRQTATLPKELEDYVEVDGDDYDEDFPTGEPLLDSGFENFLQFWITVVFVLCHCAILIIHDHKINVCQLKNRNQFSIYFPIDNKIITIKMKTIFIMFLLISTLIITSSTVTLDKQQSDFIDSINKERRYFAKAKQIGNMHKLYCDQNLQIFVNQLKVEDSRNNSYLTPVLSMDQNGISELNRARDKWWPNNTDFVFVYTRHEYMYPLQTTVACVRTEFWPRYNYSCFFGPK